jgi:electron transfer flavoprotein beta subunit
MDIIVCVKLTPDASDIEVRGDRSISLERAEWGIGGFDLQAIEAAVKLVETHGGKVIALSAGPGKINQSKLKKDILSRGPDELVMVVDEALAGADTALTAEVLAGTIKQLGPFDLVLFGEGSADLYFQQVGIQTGERLGVPTLNAISAIAVEGEKLVVERSLEDEVEVLEVPLPAALSVTTDINQPRLPTMKEILKASKKPIVEKSMADLGLQGVPKNAVETVSTHAPNQRQRKQVAISGTPEEAARALVGYLKKEGIL